MTIVELMTFVGFAGMCFSAGFAVGKLVSKLTEHNKNDRR